MRITQATHVASKVMFRSGFVFYRPLSVSSRTPAVSRKPPSLRVRGREFSKRHLHTRLRQLLSREETSFPNNAHGVLVRRLSASSLHKASASPTDSTTAPLETAQNAISGTTDAVLPTVDTLAHQQWAADAAQILAEGETFASLGLGGYTPIGLIQSSMELIYNSTGMPWWGTIIAATLCMRVCFLPVTLYLQKNSIKMHNVNPKVKQMKENQQTYMLAGDIEMANHERNKMNAVFRENGVRPIMALVPAIFQGVVMVSFFIAMRRMANAPVTSMMTGGALWFPDLTVADPSFILPIMSSAAFLISLELGGDAGIQNPQMQQYKMAFRCFALLMIAVTIKFPAGLFIYWLTSTSFSIGNALVMKIPAVRTAVGLNIVREPQEAAQKERTFVDNWRLRGLVSEKKAKQKEAVKRYEKLKKDSKPVLYETKPPPKQEKKKRKFFGR